MLEAGEYDIGGFKRTEMTRWHSGRKMPEAKMPNTEISIQTLF
jgi:hypothetical protein